MATPLVTKIESDFVTRDCFFIASLSFQIVSPSPRGNIPKKTCIVSIPINKFYPPGGLSIVNSLAKMSAAGHRPEPLVPVVGSAVFKPLVFNNATASFPVNLGMDLGSTGGLTILKTKDIVGPAVFVDTVRGPASNLAATTAAATSTTKVTSFDVAGFTAGAGLTKANYASWNFAIAPNFFDIQAWIGQGAVATPVYHNLAVIPELLLIKSVGSVADWYVAMINPADGSGHTFSLSSTAAGVAQAAGTFTGAVTAKALFPGLNGANAELNTPGVEYIAYMFANLPGVLKVGTYTGVLLGSTNVNCGFSNGARFVLIKRIDSAGDWFIFDTALGIVAGNDPHLSLNTTAAAVTTDDNIDPLASGFTVNNNLITGIDVNSSGGTYMFLAIA